MSIKIRKATSKDIPAITEIYNEAILTTDATFDIEPKSIEEQTDWFNAHGAKNPIFVAETDGKVCGWASLSQWSTRCAYSDTAEISLYIKETCRKQGIGKRLMAVILAEGEKIGLHSILSRITGENTVSIYLHEQFGFEHIGTMREVGKKFGRLLDVCMMQKIYSNPKA